MPDISTLRSKMATYYTLFASVQQLTQPVVSVPYVDAFGLGKELSLTKKSIDADEALARNITYFILAITELFLN